MPNTPDLISRLDPNQIFVFGSNDAGNHAGGAARTAVEKFGALSGVARGPQGQSWAIATLTADMQPLTLHQIRSQVLDLFHIARRHPGMEFLVTKVGCGIAGFNENTIMAVFNGAPNNVILPKGWEKGGICHGSNL